MPNLTWSDTRGPHPGPSVSERTLARLHEVERLRRKNRNLRRAIKDQQRYTNKLVAEIARLKARDVLYVGGDAYVANHASKLPGFPMEGDLGDGHP